MAKVNTKQVELITEVMKTLLDVDLKGKEKHISKVVKIILDIDEKELAVVRLETKLAKKVREIKPDITSEQLKRLLKPSKKS